MKAIALIILLSGESAARLMADATLARMRGEAVETLRRWIERMFGTDGRSERTNEVR